MDDGHLMPGSLLGTAVRRVEDPAILRGTARYVDDLDVPGTLELVFVRSTVAHAIIAGLDVDDARSCPGVVGVFTHDDLDLHPERPMFPSHPAVIRPALATDRVRFVGEPVVAIVAESRGAALDAAESVVVDLVALPAAVTVDDALAADAPLQFEAAGTNVAACVGDEPDVDPLAGSDVVVRGRFVNHRVAPVPLEGNAILVVPGDDDAEYALTVYVSTQMPHLVHVLHAHVSGVAPERVRVVAPHVGGGFGAKVVTPEHGVAVRLAQRIGRPVKWVETRSENLIAMAHGRGQIHHVEMGLRADGTIVGLRCLVLADTGAYGGFAGALALGPTRAMAQGVYRIPRISYTAAAVMTNTTPVGGFRGAGRPEATAFLERLIDIAAVELGLDPVAIRELNLLAPHEFPYRTVMGPEYDTGDYARALAEAVKIAGYEELRAEQARRLAVGATRVLGVGISTYVEITAGGPEGGPGADGEFAAIEIGADGTATVRVGTSSHGQGHATSFAMIASDRLGIPLDAIHFVQSDTAAVPRGSGTFGSRSLQFGGSAVLGAAEAVLERARTIAAELLEAADDDIVVVEGGLAVAGVPARMVTWPQLVTAGESRDTPLSAEFDFASTGATFPFGAHVAIVEVDLETGRVDLLRHVAVDDAGRILNPVVVAGQQHGGAAQGISQALYEGVEHDSLGNPLTSTLADYCMPSAAELPAFEVFNTVTPTPRNPLGAKGIGESATVGSTPAVQNAVVDALRHLGVRHVDMPCKPERVWRAIVDARAGRTADPWREPPPIPTLPIAKPVAEEHP